MKNYVKLFCLLAMLLLLNGLVEANWIRSENDMKFTPNLPNGKAGTPNKHTPHSSSDSLPAGVTKEFLNSLTDEKGQRLFTMKKVAMQCRKDSLRDSLQAISSDILYHLPEMLTETDTVI
ncbi:MAG: hypothetical protein IPL16_07470 [Ignavibacteria bacterium]|nr:hypothetical protein [Ignavibacteria bacterium]